jgi:Zn finger protein HypA/HybF involved in hydrogenase expression
MIIENQAMGDDCAHKVEILCPNCDRDIDPAELAANKCNDCGHDLSDPKQNVAIHATSVAALAVTF